jgi:homocitrate synthase NifV
LTTYKLHELLSAKKAQSQQPSGERRLLIGKHSGRHLVSRLLQERGVMLDLEETKSVLQAVRDRSVQVKRNLTTEELLSLVPAERYTHAVK